MNNTILEERGYFWWSSEVIPEGCFAPSSSVPGVLKVDEEGRSELDLDGFLPNKTGGPVPFVSDSSSINQKCIQGTLKNTGRHVLLSNLYPNGNQLRSGGISSEGYMAMDCLVGDSPFELREPLNKISGFEVNLKGFEEWLRLRTIEVKRSNTVVTAKYRKPRNIAYALSDGSITIKHDITAPPAGMVIARNTVSLKELIFLIYRFKKFSSLEQARNQYGLLQDLFILLTNSDFDLQWPVLLLGRKRTKYQYYFLRSRSKSSAPTLHETCTSFPQLRNSFGQVFSSFKQKREVFGPGFYLYLGTRRSMKLYTEHRFVNLVWGLESLHRRKNVSAPTVPGLDKKIKRILDQIGLKKDRDWLERILEHSSEPNLAQRIEQILGALPLGLDKKKVAAFSSDCAKMRNDISHFGGQRHNGNYTDFLVRLNKLSDALSYLYHALLLQEIGIAPQIIDSWIYQGLDSYWIKRLFVEVGLLD